MNYLEVRAAVAELAGNRAFEFFVEALAERYGGETRTVFVPGDPYSSAFNEGARSVIAWIRKLQAEPRKEVTDVAE